MKLLILTQKVDKEDPVLGFFNRWIEEFSKHFESIVVVCLYKGKYDFPSNISVFSLGKENGVSRLKYIFNFYKIIWSQRDNYDRVFVHMNQIYILLGGIFWKILGKEIFFWYTHRAVTLQLRLASIFPKQIFTAAKESFNVKTNKLNIMGTGVDIPKVIPEKFLSDIDSLKVVSVGRITRIKNLDILIEVVYLLKDDFKKIECDILGPCITPDDSIYFEELKKTIKDKGLEGTVIFKGSVPPMDVKDYYLKSDFNINLAPTGGMDKAVIEGSVFGTIPLVTNKAFMKIFDKYSSNLFFDGAKDLANKIKILYSKDISEKDEIKRYLLKKIEDGYSLEKLIKKISDIIVK